MGNYFSYNNVNDIFNNDVHIIDLRSYTKTINNENQNICNVFISYFNNNSIIYKKLFIDYMGTVYFLGYINNENEIDKNSTIVTVENGRKYIIFTYIPEQLVVHPFVKLNSYLSDFK